MKVVTFAHSMEAAEFGTKSLQAMPSVNNVKTTSSSTRQGSSSARKVCHHYGKIITLQIANYFVKKLLVMLVKKGI